MHVVSRQQNDFPRPEREGRPAFALDAEVKLAIEDVVIGDEMGGRPENRRAVLGCEACRDAPRREELGVQVRAPGQMRDLQDIG
jgi:hypothetical protein